MFNIFRKFRDFISQPPRLAGHNGDRADHKGQEVLQTDHIANIANPIAVMTSCIKIL